MRWAVLYARSRSAPSAFGGLLLAVAGLWAVAGTAWTPVLTTLACVSGVSIAAIGLSGQDPALDRTAALPWPVRRLAHLLLIGVVATGALLVAQRLGQSAVDPWAVGWAGVGFLGLAGIAATAAGGQFGWTLPLLWWVAAFLVPDTDGSGFARVLGWPLRVPQDRVSTWTAIALGAVGVVAYALRGTRR
ncbi:hypothetical protein [Actinosynnema pretiosum]|uniref:Uncharacterized protein n=1 Tax=Actinosynnema pretiosum TaxID=42197 RepID=A0A290ZA30_9PSEU|nr:hypothetical protein [Actinosynnema pretiosum]ATE55890.1 hypothetical protein CNX65_23570 [Actinosynnema pretiosum]